LLASLRPGGSILLIEPDFLPVSVAEPAEVREFWDGWLSWAAGRGIDYRVGRSLARRLAALGVEEVAGSAETAIYNGGSPWADYWRHDRRASRGARRLGRAGRSRDRGVPRAVRGSLLVDADHRVHRRPGPRSEVRLSRPAAREPRHTGPGLR
jgi:hypothetical protein